MNNPFKIVFKFLDQNTTKYRIIYGFVGIITGFIILHFFGLLVLPAPVLLCISFTNLFCLGYVPIHKQWVNYTNNKKEEIKELITDQDVKTLTEKIDALNESKSKLQRKPEPVAKLKSVHPLHEKDCETCRLRGLERKRSAEVYDLDWEANAATEARNSLTTQGYEAIDQLNAIEEQLVMTLDLYYNHCNLSHPEVIEGITDVKQQLDDVRIRKEKIRAEYIRGGKQCG